MGGGIIMEVHPLRLSVASQAIGETAAPKTEFVLVAED
jgi:hypothetical protein